MRIINICTSIDPIYTGLWQAAISTVDLLEKQGIESEVWTTDILEGLELPQLLRGLKIRSIGHTFSFNGKEWIEKADLDPANDIIVSHGCWYEPTRLAFALKKQGFKWLAVPHGMLEPWAKAQKKLKKQIYFPLFEQRYMKQADFIRGVSTVETARLKGFFPKNKIVHIPNGVKKIAFGEGTVFYDAKPKDVTNFVFLGRLNAQKGVTFLVEAWVKSALNNVSKFALHIIGPDHGELNNMQPFLNQSKNIIYHGAIFDGKEKAKILRGGHFYILPSMSEGFPTTVVEAMQYGNIPIITDDTNFPEAFERGIGFKIKAEVNSIVEVLNKLADTDLETLKSRFTESAALIDTEYSIDIVAQLQIDLFKKMLPLQ